MRTFEDLQDDFPIREDGYVRIEGFVVEIDSAGILPGAFAQPNSTGGQSGDGSP